MFHKIISKRRVPSKKLRIVTEQELIDKCIPMFRDVVEDASSIKELAEIVLEYLENGDTKNAQVYIRDMMVTMRADEQFQCAVRVHMSKKMKTAVKRLLYL